MKTLISRNGVLAIIGILLAVVLLGLLCTILELKMYKEFQYSNELNGYIIDAKKVPVSKAIRACSAFDDLVRDEKDLAAYQLTIELENKSVENGRQSLDRLDWFVLPGTTCQASPKTDFVIDGKTTVDNLWLSYYHEETPAAIKAGKNTYSVYLLVNATNKTQLEIEEIVDNLVIEVQTDIYLSDTEEPAFRTFTPIRWK